MKEKYCPACETVKDVSEFYKNKSRKDGYRCYCKACERVKNASREPQYKEQRKAYRQTEKYKETKRNYYKKNKKQILASSSEWYKNTENGRLCNYRNSAKSRGISWELSDEEFLSFWQKPCFYCGSEIETIGLDRVNSSKSYSLNNVVPCCSVCNKMKMELEQDFFLEKIKEIYEFKICKG